MQYRPGLLASAGSTSRPSVIPTINDLSAHGPGDEKAGTLDYFEHSGRCGFATDRVRR
jgi:hypothetical protein